ncbi:MAG: endonuclease III domain-containing protein [Candidatus Altiarchaeales archaeon]|nr:endonuclease III domain-containing protein [Candidatus Altiarchaeota archaeon]MBU4437534.1 endonuclease III domain-containing protein [Candidatus Altiarchaeota archaeon]MCG2782858.1 endonuclease III domain-containing protein [Candidatus Altiarchaeales archaeon]
MKKDLLDIHDRLLKHFGRQQWWPAETEFEVIVGAILTQNANWKNVEKAIANLRENNLLEPGGIHSVNEERLKGLIRPAGYYNSKARKLREFTNFLFENYKDLSEFLGLPQDELREQLLSIWGIGPETADSIVLYAAGKPSFVVDAYTKRIFSRMGLVEEGIEYDKLKYFFENNLPEDVGLYREFHALIVELGKNYCKTKPLCGECPLVSLCSLPGR